MWDTLCTCVTALVKSDLLQWPTLLSFSPGKSFLKGCCYMVCVGDTNTGERDSIQRQGKGLH